MKLPSCSSACSSARASSFSFRRKRAFVISASAASRSCAIIHVLDNQLSLITPCLPQARIFSLLRPLAITVTLRFLDGPPRELFFVNLIFHFLFHFDFFLFNLPNMAKLQSSCVAAHCLNAFPSCISFNFIVSILSFVACIRIALLDPGALSPGARGPRDVFRTS